MIVGNNPFVGNFEPFDGVIVFAISLLIGGAAIYIAAKHAVYKGRPGGLTFEHAVVTALLGAVVWALLSWVPLVGSLLALVGWVAVIWWRYPGGWIKAGVYWRSGLGGRCRRARCPGAARRRLDIGTRHSRGVVTRLGRLRLSSITADVDRYDTDGSLGDRS